ncbi:MAG: DNA topoisomerase 3 [Paramuribaculum sp.]|nr:DNA topoisomerase 3 [Paramuribaculum sp.]
MIVCITEKPSVARDIAGILGANSRKEGYFEGNGYAVTWTYGHLCTLKEPSDYHDNWKKWSLGVLPMIPEKFGIKLINSESIKRQFKVIATLTAQADEIINCGDAGQEGELIQRWVMQKAKVKCPVKRLWISSLTDEAIKEGFKNLKTQPEFDCLYYAGLSRAIGDWILGLNATRLYTLKYSRERNILSIGRVQTPTLALVVQRQLEIDNFVSSDYWELKTIYRGVTFSALSGKFDKEEEAQSMLGNISDKPFTVTDIKEKSGKESAPRLFDLTSLQVECNKKWGWSADYSLKLIQTLYEKKVTTYPRVDTTYLSEDLYPKVPDILRKMTPYAGLTESILNGKITKSKKIFDNSKVTDHHAIIPTGQLPNTLQGDEKLLYHLIARRFIAVFYPDCVFTTTVVEGNVDDIGFKATGKVINSPGWRAIYDQSEIKPEETDDDAIMPDFVVGESGEHSPSVIKKATQPPKYYTEGTLLRAMETAGKTIDDEELREAMKENGIGRPSTRAAIIETLFKRGYIIRKRKNIQATPAAIELIGIIQEELLKSAKLTGLWENKLRRIERGTYQASEFINDLKTLINNIVISVLSDNSNRKIDIQDAESDKKAVKAKSKSKTKEKIAKPRKKPIKSLDEIICPICGKGHLLAGKNAYGCSRYREGCKFLLPYSESPRELTPAKLAGQIKKKYESKR